MPIKLPKEFFEAKAEQAKIKTAIINAIPEGISYENLLVVLSELSTYYLKEFLQRKEEDE